MMNKALKLLSILLLAFTAIGCAFIEDLLGITPDLPDLTATGVGITRDSSTGVVSSVQFTLKNAGDGDSAEAEYSIVLTADSTIDMPVDITVLTVSIALASGAEQTLSVSTGDISSYISAHSISIPNGKYFVGVYIDPDAGITEGSESNNDAVDTTSLFFYGNQPMAYGVQGTVTLPAGVQYYNIGRQNVPDGTYDICIGLTTTSFITSSSGLAIDAESIMSTGSIVVSSAFTQAAGTTIDYTIFVPVKGNYAIFAIMDAFNGGDIEYYYNGIAFVPSEPYWFENKSISGDLTDYYINIALP